MPRQRYLTISDVLFSEYLLDHFKTGYESPKVRYRIKEGIPADAKLMDIKLRRFISREEYEIIEMIFESPSFDDVGNIYDLPSIQITSEIINE